MKDNNDYIRKSEVLKIIDDIQEETHTFEPIQLMVLKDHINTIKEFDTLDVLIRVNSDKIRNIGMQLAKDYDMFSPLLDRESQLSIFGLIVRKIFESIYEESTRED